MCFSVVIKTIFVSTNYDMIFAKGSRGAIKRLKKILPTPFAKFNQTKSKLKNMEYEFTQFCENKRNLCRKKTRKKTPSFSCFITRTRILKC